MADPQIAAPSATIGESDGKPGAPALSATSDTPSTERVAPALSVSTTTKTTGPELAVSRSATTVVDANPAIVGAEPVVVDPAAEPVAVTETKSEPKADGISRRMGELAAQRKEAEAKATEAAARATAAETAAAATQARLDKALAAVETLTAPKPEPPEPKPTRDTFDNPDAYDTALVEWGQRQGALAASREAEAQLVAARAREAEIAAAAAADKDAAVKAEATRAAEARAAAEIAATTAAWQTRRAEAVKEFPDYTAVVEGPEADNLQISIPMAHAIMGSEMGPALAYYLAKNPDESARIASLPDPVRQAVEIGRIESRLSAPKPAVTKAPPPITPVGSRSAAVEKTPDEMSMDEYAARRMPALRAERQPFVGGRPH